MTRKTRYHYREPGSVERVIEAVRRYEDADSDDDVDYHRAYAGLVAALLAFKFPDERVPKRRQRPSRYEQPALPMRVPKYRMGGRGET